MEALRGPGKVVQSGAQPMNPEDMAEKIVRYEWQSIAELASLLGTWQGQVRKECADRAIEHLPDWCVWGDDSEAARKAFRAAIMGAGKPV